MRLQYDPGKAAANLKKHGVSFADAEGVLEDPLALTMPDPDTEGEECFVTIGLGSAGELLVVVYAERDRVSNHFGPSPDAKGTEIL